MTPAFDQAIAVGQAVHAGRDRAVAAERLVDEAELIGVVPDVGAGAGDGEGVVALVRRSRREALEEQPQRRGAADGPDPAACRRSAWPRSSRAP